MKVEKVMRRNVLTTVEGESLAAAAKKMWWAKIRHLPVMRDGEPIGLLTELDLLAWCAAPGRSIAGSTVRQAMSSGYEVCEPTEEIAALSARMAKSKAGCALALDGGRLAGIVTTTDLLGFLARGEAPEAAPSSPPASTFMTRDPVTAFSDDYLIDAAAKMAERNIRHLPVVDGERRVVGMLSDRDVRDAIGEPRQALENASLPTSLRLLRVSEVMTPGVLAVDAASPLLEIATWLAGERLGALPVVDGDERLVGIVSYVDVMREMVRSAALERDVRHAESRG